MALNALLLHITYPVLRTTLVMRQMFRALGLLTATPWASVPPLVGSKARARSAVSGSPPHLLRKNLSGLLLLCELRPLLLDPMSLTYVAD